MKPLSGTTLSLQYGAESGEGQHGVNYNRCIQTELGPMSLENCRHWQLSERRKTSYWVIMYRYQSPSLTISRKWNCFAGTAKSGLLISLVTNLLEIQPFTTSTSGLTEDAQTWYYVTTTFTTEDNRVTEREVSNSNRTNQGVCNLASPT